MGSTHLFLLSSSPINYLTLNPRKPPQFSNFYSRFRSSSPSRSNQGTISDAFRSGRFDFDDDFRGEKRRNWWSDDDDDDDDDEDEDEEFVFWEEVNSIDWVFKVLGTFGWMVPAVIISMLLGTGTNSLIMALILPLGQTALSLVMDRLGGSPSSGSNSSPRYKSRARPRNRYTANNSYVGNAYGNQRNAGTQDARSRTSPGRGGYQSWRSANNSSVNKAGESRSRFGGWDELDEQVGTTSSFSREGKSREVNGVRRQDVWSGKLSRRRNRDKPLLMRLLIAVFPLLGSWTRFLF